MFFDGCASIGRPEKTYIHQLCLDTGYWQKDRIGVMDDRDGWQERIWELLSALLNNDDDDYFLRHFCKN